MTQLAKAVETINHSAAHSNSTVTTPQTPKISQVDQILNRSRLIWSRDQNQQASNNN